MWIYLSDICSVVMYVFLLFRYHVNNYLIWFVNSKTKGIEIRLEYRYEKSLLYSMIKMKKTNSEHFSIFFNMHVYYYFTLKVFILFYVCVCVCVCVCVSLLFVLHKDSYIFSIFHKKIQKCFLLMNSSAILKAQCSTTPNLS